MFTLGYPFRPWTGAKAIAEGPAILAYLRETAREHGIDRQIRFEQRVLRADWSSETASWTVDIERGAAREPVRMRCGFLFMCSGYFRYAEGYAPAFPGAERFAGRIVHPQQWPEDLDVAGQQVVVIGSGATAVTLVPSLAEEAAHVTMLQRSPTYVASRPASDPIADWLRARLPQKLAYAIVRWKNALQAIAIFNRLDTLLPEMGTEIAALHRRQVNQMLVTVRRQPGRRGQLQNPQIGLTRKGMTGSVSLDGLP